MVPVVIRVIVTVYPICQEQNTLYSPGIKFNVTERIRTFSLLPS